MTLPFTFASITQVTQDQISFSKGVAAPMLLPIPDDMDRVLLQMDGLQMQDKTLSYEFIADLSMDGGKSWYGSTVESGFYVKGIGVGGVTLDDLTKSPRPLIFYRSPVLPKGTNRIFKVTFNVKSDTQLSTSITLSLIKDASNN